MSATYPFKSQPVIIIITIILIIIIIIITIVLEVLGNGSRVRGLDMWRFELGMGIVNPLSYVC